MTADLLLGAALRVYAAEGERGITVGAVTRVGGVSLGSLYHHFGSVDGLMAALTQRWLSRLLGELVMSLQDARTARAGIRAPPHDARTRCGRRALRQGHPDVHHR